MKDKQEVNLCVIGAGVCGIVATKIGLESGFKVTCFERSSHYGGLWNYKDISNSYDAKGEFVPSVMRTTILNTSKELSAFSDFPPPPETPNYMKHDLYMDYIHSYVQHFKLEAHMKLEHQVIHCEPEYDEQNDSTSWTIEVESLKTGEISKLKFDKLMVAIGHHNIPYMPSFRDQQKFKGLIIHSAKVKDILTDERFFDKRVLIVGLGNSACDAANDVALVAKKCYVSCHRGNWVKNRLLPTGLYDFHDQNRWNLFRSKYKSKSRVDKEIIAKCEARTNHQLLGLKPKHKPSELVPTINDLFPYRIFTGGVCLKNPIVNFTHDGVVFEGEEEIEYEVDVVVLATGYTARVPFLNEFELGLKRAEHNEYELFLNIFAPNFTITGLEKTPESAIKSLAFIGLAQPSASITVLSEIQSRYAALVFAGKVDLPTASEMIKENSNFETRRSLSIKSHSRDQIIGNWVEYLDKVAARAGVKPNLSRLFFKDFALWKKLVFGPSVPYQYRLSGPGSWSKARETIMNVDFRVLQGINDGKNHILYHCRRKCLKDCNTSQENGKS